MEEAMDYSEKYNMNTMDSYYEEDGGDYGDYPPGIGDMILQQEITSIINTYVLPTLLLVGLVGNTLCVVVMVILGCRLLSSCFYLALLAVVDTFLLCLRGDVWLYNVTEMELTHTILVHSAVSCQVYSFVCSLILHLAGWLLTTLMIEICLVCHRPQDVKTLCTAERAKNGILFIVLLLTCLNAHFFWTYGLVAPFPGSTEKMCTFSPHGSYYNDYFRKVVWPIIDAVAANFLPNLAILICICFIVTSVCLGRKKPEHNIPASGRGHAFDINERRTLRGFIILCAILGVCGLAFTLPFSTYNMYELVLERMRDEMAPPFDEQSSMVKRSLAQALTYACRDMFLSCKLFIYLACWRIFRLRMRKIVTCNHFRVWVRKRRGKYGSRQYRVKNGPETVGLRSRTD